MKQNRNFSFYGKHPEFREEKDMRKKPERNWGESITHAVSRACGEWRQLVKNSLGWRQSELWHLILIFKLFPILWSSRRSTISKPLAQSVPDTGLELMVFGESKRTGQFGTADKTERERERSSSCRNCDINEVERKQTGGRNKRSNWKMKAFHSGILKYECRRQASPQHVG